jgi:hypothetical protein
MRNNMSRPEANIETDILNIKNVYQTNEIHINLQKYYHILKDMESKLETVYLFDDINDIDDFDYIKPIKKLNEIYNSEYLKNLEKYTTSDNIPLNNYNYIDFNDREEIFLIYLKSKKYITFEIMEDKIDQIRIDELKSKGIYYMKTLNMTKEMYQNLFFFINNDKTYQNRIEEFDRLNFIEKQVAFIFYKDTNFNENTVLLGEILFNQNNIEMLKTLDIRNLTSPFLNQNLLYIHTLRVIYIKCIMYNTYYI